MVQANRSDPRPVELGDATVAALAAAMGASVAGPDRELASYPFLVATAFTGAAVGDALLGIRVINTSTGQPVIEGNTLWVNETQQTVLASPPDFSKLTPVGIVGLTAAQLMAMVLKVTSATPSAVTATIANGASLSGAIQIDGKLSALAMPAAFTNSGATVQPMTFDGSSDGVTFAPIFDLVGGTVTERTITAAQMTALAVASPGRSLALNPVDWMAYSHIKIRSGTAAAPVNQNGARTIVAGLAG